MSGPEPVETSRPAAPQDELRERSPSSGPEQGRGDVSATSQGDTRGDTQGGQEGDTGPRPPLFVIRGTATDEEVAALTVVLQAVTAAAPADRPPPRPEWNAAHRRLNRLVGRPLSHGPAGWRSSSLP